MQNALPTQDFFYVQMPSFYLKASISKLRYPQCVCSYNNMQCIVIRYISNILSTTSILMYLSIISCNM